MTTTYAAVIAATDAIAQEMGDAAVGALTLEMSLTLARKPYKRRILAAAARR
jgi:hypothetical protein